LIQLLFALQFDLLMSSCLYVQSSVWSPSQTLHQH